MVRPSSVSARVSTADSTLMGDQRCRKANFSATFSSISEAFAVVQKYLADNVFVYYPPVSRKGDTVDQSTDGVCSSNLPAPFQASQLSLKVAYD